MMSQNEDNFETPLSNTHQKLLLILQIIEKVENPSVDLSFLEITDLLSDVAELLLQAADRPSGENPDVFEDPLNRGDDLGNVRMISHKIPRAQQETCKEIGFLIYYILYKYRMQISDLRHYESLVEEIDFRTGDWDLVECEDSLKSKARISMLRKDNYRLDQKNYRLTCRLHRAERRIEKLRSYNKSLMLLNLFLACRSRSKSSPNASPTQFVPARDSGLTNSELEIRRCHKSGNSQIDSLKWDDDGN
jgi:hypothetical protein